MTRVRVYVPGRTGYDWEERDMLTLIASRLRAQVNNNCPDCDAFREGALRGARMRADDMAKALFAASWERMVLLAMLRSQLEHGGASK